MPKKTPKAFLCVPMMNESENITAFLDTIKNQNTEAPLHLIACVNQPHSFWGDKQKRHICEDNQKTLQILSQEHEMPLTIIDRSTQGWDEKHYGVGWARKLAMDKAAEKGSESDLIFSMDADTYYPPDYIEKTMHHLTAHPEKAAVAVPYYHPLPENKPAARAILRYEIYMRHYALNMWKINSPYKFTALGSAMALPVASYKKVGGITPKISGEDFYFLQKLRKSGEILHDNPVKAYPQARFSDRVFFGTGPAMLKGADGNWKSYPLYHPSLFEELKQIYQSFKRYFNTGSLGEQEQNLKTLFSETDWLLKLRQNSADESQFIRKCHEKFDGLKILQYLKKRQQSIRTPENRILLDFLTDTYPEKTRPYYEILKNVNFQSSSIADLNNIRNLMVQIEDSLLKGDNV